MPDVQRVEDPLGRLPHRDLRRIELAEIAAVADHQHDRDLRGDVERSQRVDAVAEPAVLHEEGAPLAAEPGAGQDAEGLLFARRRHDRAGGIGPEMLQHLRDDVVGDGGEEADVVAAEHVRHVLGPARVGHASLPAADDSTRPASTELAGGGREPGHAAGPKTAPTAVVTAIARAPQNTTRTAPVHGRAPPTLAASHPRTARSASDAPATIGRSVDVGAERDGHERGRGAHREAGRRRERRLEGPRAEHVGDAQLVARVAGQRIVRHQLDGHLLREARIEAAADVDRGQLGQLRVRLRGQLLLLAAEIGVLRVGLGADRHVLPGGHRHRAGDEPGGAGDQHARGAGVGRRHAEDEAGRRHDAVVGSEDRGAKPADVLRAMHLRMT